jgi:hypothetical protein
VLSLEKINVGLSFIAAVLVGTTLHWSFQNLCVLQRMVIAGFSMFLGAQGILVSLVVDDHLAHPNLEIPLFNFSP